MKRSRDQMFKKVVSNWDNHDENEDKLFKFIPSLHIQRKRKVLDVVMEYVKYHFPIKTSAVSSNFKVIDVGCEKCAFFQYLQMEFIGLKNKFDTEYIGIDIDEYTLMNDTIENLRRNNIGTLYDIRNGDVAVKLLAESILEPNIQLDRPDILIMIEVIEHLQLNEAQNLLPNSIFGIICPKVAIITTPNADFNVVFGMRSRLQFRHWDHKFEWDRREFKTWCDKVIEQYPDYEYKLDDIGISEQHREKGGGSQMAVFTRKNMRPLTSNSDLKLNSKVVYDKQFFFHSQNESEAVRKFLNNQMSTWAIERQIFFPTISPNINNNSVESDQDFIDDSLYRLEYDDFTGDETFRVPVEVVRRIVNYNFSSIDPDLDLESIIKQICQDHAYFKYDGVTSSIYYTITNENNEISDEDEYFQTMAQLSSNFQTSCEM